MGSWQWQTFIQDTMMINGTMVPEKKDGNWPWEDNDQVMKRSVCLIQGQKIRGNVSLKIFGGRPKSDNNSCQGTSNTDDKNSPKKTGSMC